ncbi:MAG: tyrosine-type recombinase/integrase [Mycobacterium sp.]|uniref:tyrosine-type recombinase/integrase n=1 Tax=Mycobacterium sp. TaxID=1785 RepID=UPI003BB79263
MLPGVEGVGVHTLRHSAAVGWLEAGVHIKAVADLLGHSSIAITGDDYGHTTDDIARAAVDGWSGCSDCEANRRCATYCATYPGEVSDVEIPSTTVRPTTCAFSGRADRI